MSDMIWLTTCIIALHGTFSSAAILSQFLEVFVQRNILVSAFPACCYLPYLNISVLYLLLLSLVLKMVKYLCKKKSVCCVMQDSFKGQADCWRSHPPKSLPDQEGWQDWMWRSVVEETDLSISWCLSPVESPLLALVPLWKFSVSSEPWRCLWVSYKLSSCLSINAFDRHSCKFQKSWPHAWLYSQLKVNHMFFNSVVLT